MVTSILHITSTAVKFPTFIKTNIWNSVQNGKIINRKITADCSLEVLQLSGNTGVNQQRLFGKLAGKHRTVLQMWGAYRRCGPCFLHACLTIFNYMPWRLLLKNSLLERKTYTAKWGLTHFLEHRAEKKRRKSPGYSRFFSPLHLDPALILGEMSTAAVTSTSQSSSSSDSTAMPGKQKWITSTWQHW